MRSANPYVRQAPEIDMTRSVPLARSSVAWCLWPEVGVKNNSPASQREFLGLADQILIKAPVRGLVNETLVFPLVKTRHSLAEALPRRSFAYRILYSAHRSVPLSFPIEAIHEIRGDARDKRLETSIPSVLLPVENLPQKTDGGLTAAGPPMEATTGSEWCSNDLFQHLRAQPRRRNR